MAATEITYR